MAVLGKSGFFSIGYIENRASYAAEIRRLCGENIDYEILGKYVDEQWNNRHSHCACWNRQMKPVAPDAPDIAYLMVDTGYQCSADGQRIYGGFTARTPGAGLDAAASFKGVLIGTQNDILAIWRVSAGTLNNYTTVRDYQNVARVLNTMTGQHKPVIEWEIAVQGAFNAAQQDGKLGVYTAGDPAISFFPLQQRDLANEPIWLEMEQNNNPALGQPWFGLMAVSENALLEQILDRNCYHLGNMIFKNAGMANSFLQQLAEMAMEETWTSSVENSAPYGILRSYMTHTLYRLLDEDRQAAPGVPPKVDKVNGRIFFNTGLLNRLFRQILIAGDYKQLKVEIPGYGMHAFDMMDNVMPYSENDREIASVYDGEVYKIPKIACFFTDYQEVVFNAHYAIRLNDLHIFEDGVERRRLLKYDAEFQSCKSNLAAKEALLARVARDFDSAILRAKLMAERNYKLAVPQFWRETGEIQFLLPIYLGELEEADKPQCALALSLDTTGRIAYYRGATILTLDMAYNNARLIAKPDIFWLNSSV